MAGGSTAQGDGAEVVTTGGFVGETPQAHGRQSSLVGEGAALEIDVGDISESCLPSFNCSLPPLEGIEIFVSDPQKQGTGLFGEYFSFEVKTKTSLPQFEGVAEMVVVRRRYTHFMWLRESLLARFPGAIVPPVPAKKNITAQVIAAGKHLERTIEVRRRALQVFLYRLMSHPLLSVQPEVVRFLRVPDWDNMKPPSASASGMLTIAITRAERGVKRLAMNKTYLDFDPDCEKVEAMKDDILLFGNELARVLYANRMMYKRERDVGRELRSMKVPLSRLSRAEPALSAAFMAYGATTSVLGATYTEQAFQDKLNLIAELKEYVLYFNAVKDAFSARENAVQAHIAACRQLERHVNEKRELAEQLANPARKVGLMASMKQMVKEAPSLRVVTLEKVKIPEDEKLVADTQTKMVEVGNRLMSELQRFRKLHVADIQRMLAGYVQMRVQFLNRISASWTELLPSLEAMAYQSNQATSATG